MAYKDWSDKIFPSRIRIGDENTPDHPLHIIGEGSGSTTSSLRLDNSNNSRLLEVYDGRTLFMGDGSANNAYMAHLKTDVGVFGGNLPRMIYLEDTTDNLETDIRASQILVTDNDNDSNILFSAFNGRGRYWVRNANGSTDYFRIDTNGLTTDFEYADTYRFTVNNRPVRLLMESDIFLIGKIADADSSTTTTNSAKVRLQSEFYDGSNNHRNTEIQRIQDITGGTGSRLKISTSHGSLDVNMLDTGEVGIGTTTPNSTVDVNGSFGAAILSGDTDYTATTSDHTLLGDASNGSFTFTLPSPSSVEGRFYNIKKIDSTGNAVNIDVEDGSNIDGDTTKSIATQYNSIILQAFGNRYWMI